VALLPTTLKADQILFTATALGGTSLASDDEFAAARVADEVIPAGGVGALSEVVVDKLLTGKSLAVQPFITEISEGMRGGSSPRDLETMFQLINLRFTEPRADPTVFAAMKARALAMLVDQSAAPEVLFSQTLASALSANHARRQPETAATVATWNLDTSLAFYKARFADASNFRFVFVGSFTLETMRPLIETYIASLPATHGGETWRDLGVKLPGDVVQTTVRKGIAPKSSVAIVFSGPFEFTPSGQLALQTATMLLQSRLSETIREQLGATYAISADSETSRYPRPEYRVSIEWTCDPAKVESLVQRVFKEVAAVRETRLTEDQMGGVRGYLQRELDRSSQDNGYLLNQILRRYESGEPLGRDVVSERAAEIRILTADAVSRAAVRYLDPSRYVRLTLMPDTVP
jgi:zinc protease